MEPAPVLIRAFEIHLDGPAQLRSGLDDGRMTAAGIEPHVENVALLAKLLAAALRASRARRQQLPGAAAMPLVDAATVAEDVRDVLDEALLDEDGVARLAVERDDRHTPHPLPRDRPVGPVLDHVED